MTDQEKNSLPRRVARYARVGAGVGGAAARIGAARLFGRALGDPKNAADLVATLGGLKGPLMKVAQMMATIPDLMWRRCSSRQRPSIHSSVRQSRQCQRGNRSAG